MSTMSLNIGRAASGRVEVILIIFQKVGEHRHVRRPARRYPTILRLVAADRIDKLGALPHHQIARAEHEPCGLLFLALHRDEAHAGALRRFADRLRIDRIVLVPPLRTASRRPANQPHIMPHRLQLACPVMRAAASFERNRAHRLTGEEVEQLAPGKLATEHHHTALVGAVRMKNVLAISRPMVITCDTDASLSGVSTPPLWHIRCRRGRPPIRFRGVFCYVASMTCVRICGLYGPR